MTRTRQAITAGGVGIPVPTVRPPSTVPLADKYARWEFVEWESVLRSLDDGQAVTLTCDADEVNAILVRLLRCWAFGGEVPTPTFDHRYDPSAGLLWLYPSDLDTAIARERSGTVRTGRASA